MQEPAASSPYDAAVVDVGSNSVRLVVYRVDGRAIWSVFNEKVLAGLGEGLPSTGRLSSKGAPQALAALRRYKAVLDAARPDRVHVVATAAVRDASDGLDFVDLVRRETGLEIRVLTGAEEARYSALGVLAGAPASEGTVADLGGSSLELVRVRNASVEGGATYPLGPFSLGAPRELNREAVRRVVGAALADASEPFYAKTLHAVGGAWRNLSLIYMRLSDYPLQIVHQFEMTGAQAVEVAQVVARQSRGSLERTPGISRKRMDTLPYAALVLESLIERIGFETVSFSAYGVREGLLFEAMPPAVRSQDPLIEGCGALGGRQGVAVGLGPALARWLEPVFDTLPPVFSVERDRTLTSAAARLADVGSRLHPDHRADLAYTQVLRAPIAGQTHPERAFVAGAVYARYGGSSPPPEAAVVRRLLSTERASRARALGLAMRLGCDLSARSAALLDRSALRLERGRLVLSAEPGWADMLLGAPTAKRAGALAAALGVELEMRPG